MVRLSFGPAFLALQVRRSQYGGEFGILKAGQETSGRRGQVGICVSFMGNVLEADLRPLRRGMRFEIGALGHASVLHLVVGAFQVVERGRIYRAALYGRVEVNPCRYAAATDLRDRTRELRIEPSWIGELEPRTPRVDRGNHRRGLDRFPITEH